MLLHMPWSRNLSGARVQLELAEEFIHLGGQVKKFDWNDPFPLQQRFPPDFPLPNSEFAFVPEGILLTLMVKNRPVPQEWLFLIPKERSTADS